MNKILQIKFEPKCLKQLVNECFAKKPPLELGFKDVQFLIVVGNKFHKNGAEMEKERPP